MPLRDSFDDIDWWDFREEVDRRLTDVLLRQIGTVPLTVGMADEIADGFCQLQNLRSGKEPDYHKLGVALAYMFKFMPFRISSVVAALTLLQNHSRHPPHRILDIGSGTDASRLALDLCLTPPHRFRDGYRDINLVTWESGAAMHTLAQAIPVGPGLGPGSIVRYSGKFDFHEAVALSNGCSDLAGPFDLVILSAVLPYNLAGTRHVGFWNTLAWSLAKITADPGVIIFISPHAKREYSQSFAAAFTRSDQATVYPYFNIGPKTSQSRFDLGSIVESRRPMRRLTGLLCSIAPQIFESAALGGGRDMVNGMVRFGIDSWNDSTPEHIAIVKVYGHRDGFRPVAPYRLL